MSTDIAIKTPSSLFPSESECPHCGRRFRKAKTNQKFCSQSCGASARIYVLRPIEERLETKTLKLPSGCWEWIGAKDCHGYGRIGTSKSKVALAHRVSFERWRNVIPPGMVIDHLCRNPSCINPDHLDVVTQKTNVRRGLVATVIVCRNGHLLAADNVRYLRRGDRVCKTCAKSARDRMASNKMEKQYA